MMVAAMIDLGGYDVRPEHSTLVVFSRTGFHAQFRHSPFPASVANTKQGQDVAIASF
jgi:hypothetical protein